MSSQGSQAKLCMEVDATIDGSSEPYEFLSWDASGTSYSLVKSEGIRGTLYHAKERVRSGNIAVAGTLSLNPSPTELNRILPRLGFTESTGVFTPTDTLPDVWVCVDSIGKVHTYNQGKVSKATFSGSSGQPLKLALEFLFRSISEGNAGTFPSLTIDTDSMYVFSDAALTLQGTGSRKFDDFSLSFDFKTAARFMNSQTATDIKPTDCEITLALSTPYTSSETDLFTTPQSSSAGAAATLVFTNGGQSASFALANVKSVAKPPSIQGRGEIHLPLTYDVFSSSTTKPVVITLDNTA